MKDKAVILNEFICSAADIMEAKAEYTESVLLTLVDKNGGEETPAISQLEKYIERTRAAVALMREYAGCWA